MGIGEAIANSVAEQGANLILFARSEVRKYVECYHDKTYTPY